MLKFYLVHTLFYDINNLDNSKLYSPFIYMLESKIEKNFNFRKIFCTFIVLVFIVILLFYVIRELWKNRHWHLKKQ